MEEYKKNESIQQENQNNLADIQAQEQTIQSESDNTSYETILAQGTPKSIGEKIGRLLIIISVIGIIFTLFLYVIPIFKRAKYEKGIDKSISIIEQTFHPNEIEVTPLSPPDVILIKQYQDSVLMLVAYLKEVRNIKPASYYKNSNVMTLMNVTLSNQNTINNFQKSIVSVLKKLNDLSDYGKSNSIYLYVPDFSRFHQLYNSARDMYEKNQMESNKVTKRLTDTSNRYESLEKITNPQKDFYIVLRDSYKLWENIEYYKFEYLFLTFLIETNQNFMTHYNYKYKNMPAQANNGEVYSNSQ